MAFLVQLMLWLLPWCMRRRILCAVFGYKIHPTAKIGFSIVLPRKLEMGNGCKIGHFVICRNIDRLAMADGSGMGSFHLITGIGVSMNRDARLDWIKGFLIVCVVLGHTMRVGFCAPALEAVVSRGIYGFHMPLFMLLCGYFFKIEDPKSMVRKTVRRLVIPYFIGSIFFGGHNIVLGKPILLIVENTICGRCNGVLWFLYSVALVQLVIIFGVWMQRRVPSLSIPTVVTGFALGLESPLRCESWMLFYFGAGFLLAHVKTLMPKGWIGLVGFSAFMYWGHPWYTQLGWQTVGLSLCALMVLMSMAEKMANRLDVGRVGVYLGRHTMIILIFHPFFNRVFKLVQSLILSIDGSGILFFLANGAFVICGCLILEVVLRRLRIGFLFGLKCT